MKNIIIGALMLASSATQASPVIHLWECTEANGPKKITISRPVEFGEGGVIMVLSAEGTPRPLLYKGTQRLANNYEQYSGTRGSNNGANSTLYVSIDTSKPAQAGSVNAEVQIGFREVLYPFTCLRARHFRGGGR
ncbi:MAG TPA: hypothetical protein VFV50_17315 [Bdellovibrionales bacterium]|nr:hypothetical protein [Bdellovibrionales bacterium]